MKSGTQALLFTFSLLVITTLSSCDGTQTYSINSELVTVDSLDQIVTLQDSLVKPIRYKNIRSFEYLPMHEAKRKFVSAILPSILLAKHEIHTQKTKVTRLHQKKVWDTSDSILYLSLKRIYKAKNIDDLLSRLVTLPNSIVLAQAAIETGWGESRFFVQASNLFGIWSYDETESRIAAGKNRDDKTIFVRSYDDISGSVSDYFKVIARHNAYKSLRKARQKTSDPYALTTHLKNYSERKSWYTRQLRQVIRQNNLTKYDSYRIDPNYLIRD
jgi:Bax protein